MTDETQKGTDRVIIKEIDRIIIPVALYDSLISYLIEKPYKEVGVLLPRLHQEAQIIKGNSDDE